MYIHLNVCQKTNDVYFIVTGQYMKPFNCVQKKIRWGSFGNVIKNMETKPVYLPRNHVTLYSYKEDLALKKLSKLICYETQWTKLSDVMVIVIGNEHSDTSSNPGRDLLPFT